MLGKNIADLSRQVEKCAVSSRNVLFFLEVEALVFLVAYLYSKGSIFSLKKKNSTKKLWMSLGYTERSTGAILTLIYDAMSSFIMIFILFLEAKLRTEHWVFCKQMSVLQGAGDFPGALCGEIQQSSKATLSFLLYFIWKSVEQLAFCKLCICFKMS